MVLGTRNKRREIGEILRENKGERRVALRSEEKDSSCESNAFIETGDVRGNKRKRRCEGRRGENEVARGKRRKGRSESKCIGEQDGDEDEKSILSLEMPATNCPARDKILAVVRNSARDRVRRDPDATTRT